MKAEKYKNAKRYAGDMVLHSVHGDTHEKISLACHEDISRGEDYMFYVLQSAHPHAMRECFEIEAQS